MNIWIEFLLQFMAATCFVLIGVFLREARWVTVEAGTNNPLALTLLFFCGIILVATAVRL